MLSNLFSAFFGKNDNPSDIAKLEEISNGMSEFASYMLSTDKDAKKEKGQEMLSIISSIEKRNRDSNDTNFLYALTIAYKNYCAWFVRGDKRKEYLEKSVSFLKKAISVSPRNIEAKSALAKLLIEEKVIRDIEAGIGILEELQKNNQMPDHLNSTLAKAKRQSQGVKLEDTYHLCSFSDPSPAVFSEERKRFRALIRLLKKEENTEQLKTTLNRYYQLAVLVRECYKEHDCNSAVSGGQYSDAVKIVKKVCKEINFSYSEHGKIANGDFISENDWKTFIKVFGENKNNFNYPVF